LLLVVVSLNDVAKSGFGLAVLAGGQEFKPHSYTLPYVLSAASIAGGIVLFIAASTNRSKANAISFNFKMEKATMVQLAGITRYYYPCMAVKLKL
jgi:hypothetical protein